MFRPKFICKLLIVCFVTLSVLIGCSGTPRPGNESTGPGTADKAGVPGPYTGGPVELLIKDVNTAIFTDQDIQKVMMQAVKAKYPEITLRIVNDKIEDMIASGSPPDMVALSHSQLANYKSLDLPDDLRMWIKQRNIDLTSLDPVVMNAIKDFGPSGEIFGLPFGMNHGALIYNKDIFDKFGLPYPKDSLAWEEVVEMNRRLTRLEGGVQYIGAATSSFLNMTRQYGLSLVDEKNEKAVLTSDGFRHVFGLMQQLFQAPGYVQNSNYTYKNTDFYRDQTLVMQANWIAAVAGDIKKLKPPFKWDLTAFPVYKDRPAVGNPVDFHMLAVSKTSKHKDAAIRVLETLLSKEAQLAISKSGRISVLADPQIKVTFAEDSGIFTEKNLKAIFNVSAAPLVRSDFSEYKDVISPFITDAVKNIAVNKADINTALRQAEEQANQKVRSMKEAQR